MKRLESRAAEILGNLGRMDRMLDSLVEDSLDCPHLFILTPATGTPAVSFREHPCYGGTQY